MEPSSLIFLRARHEWKSRNATNRTGLDLSISDAKMLTRPSSARETFLLDVSPSLSSRSIAEFHLGRRCLLPGDGLRTSSVNALA